MQTILINLLFILNTGQVISPLRHARHCTARHSFQLLIHRFTEPLPHPKLRRLVSIMVKVIMEHQINATNLHGKIN